MELFSESLVREASTSYEEGNPILSDQEFDLLSSHGLDQEVVGHREKVNHSIPMGSLRKITSSDDMIRWWHKYNFKMLIIMPKLDGSSIALSYRDGRLISAASRGDGVVGHSILSNIRHTVTSMELNTDGLPRRLEVRAEAIIPKRFEGDHEKSLRNVCSGRLMAKTPEATLAQIETRFFDVFDLDATEQPSWNQKKAWLYQLPQHLCVSYRELIPGSVETLYDDLEKTYQQWKNNSGYELDGLVVMGIQDPDAPLPEPEIDPKQKVAVKFKQEGVETTIDDICWQLGKYGKLTPVLCINPRNIGGVTVSRISASNYSLLHAAGLGVGAKIKCVRSGDVIPYASEIIEPSYKNIDLPLCPACKSQSKLSERKIDAICMNPLCEGQELVYLQKMIELLEIDSVSDKTIESLVHAGFDSLEKLFLASIEDISALPGFGLKSATHLVTSLKNATLTEDKVIKAVGLKGIGRRKGALLLAHYGTLDAMLTQIKMKGIADIEGFGPVQGKMIEENIDQIESARQQLATLGITILPLTTPKKEIETMERTMICATGAAPGMPRWQFEDLIASKGYILQDKVNKDTQLVVCADPDGSSSKLKKARSQGTKIVSYDEFLPTLN